jgi:hypothetical protein
MALIPPRFLFRLAYPCRYVKAVPRDKGDRLLDLPENCRIDNFAAMNGPRNFADVRIAWNDLGLGIQVQVGGKDQPVQCDAGRLRGSDGLTVWLDTRDARAGHRATRYCHQFHLLPSGGGPDHDQPLFAQTKINRALQDAPMCAPSADPYRAGSVKGGYFVEVFLPSAALNGFDPEQSRRLGFFYAVHDAEHGAQTLSVGSEFPYWEDPSLWSVLELVR